MPILDCHQHFWNYNPVEYEWIQDSMSILKQDYLPEHLAEVYAQNQITGCVAVQASSTERETDRLLDYAVHYDFIKGVVGWVDLLHPNLPARLHHYSTFAKFKGVRHILQAESPEFIDAPAFQQGISQLKSYNLTYDILIYPRHLYSAFQLVKKFPDQKFVIDHGAKPMIKAKHFWDWKDLMENFRDQPHVYCKVSGLVTEADWKQWAYKDFIPVLDILTDVFGPERLMFGSDWPVCLIAASYRNVLDIIKTYTDRWSDGEKHKLFYQNAINFYNLDA
jgi:L-fuconolactonase